MKLGTCRIHGQLLIQMLRGELGHFTSDLPGDAKLIGAYCGSIQGNPATASIAFVISSESLPECEDGGSPAEFPVVMKREEQISFEQALARLMYFDSQEAKAADVEAEFVKHAALDLEIKNNSIAAVFIRGVAQKAAYCIDPNESSYMAGLLAALSTGVKIGRLMGRER